LQGRRCGPGFPVRGDGAVACIENAWFAIAGLRRFISIGTDVEDPRIARLVGEMSLASEPFRRLWTRHDVGALAAAPARMCHPQVRMLELRRE
jgi:MmyB-like transcription regulator ligand binding domain